MGRRNSKRVDWGEEEYGMNTFPDKYVGLKVCVAVGRRAKSLRYVPPSSKFRLYSIGGICIGKKGQGNE